MTVVEDAELARFTLEEVAQHNSRASCWVVLHGQVYDFTDFLPSHPGGERGLLRHAGSDCSDVFAELHSQSIFAAFGPAYRIGELVGSEARGAGGDAAADAAERWGGVAPDARGWAGLPTPLSDVAPTETVLPSPFPHDAFTGNGCETYRFHWAVADRLLRANEDGRSASPRTEPAAGEGPTEFAMHRQKSNLGLLNAERDWLHVGAPDVYAAEMRIKRELILHHAEKVYVRTDETRDAEWEALGEALAFLGRNYPDRFAIEPPCREPMGHTEATVVETLTPGYRHRFVVGDWRDTPLKLLGQLCQEDFYLLAEKDAEEEGWVLPSGENMAPHVSYGWREHLEEHPSGKQHVLLGGVSCFSFNLPPRQFKPMSAIHHPNVPGWALHLQRSMNRLFSSLEPGVDWFRYTQEFSFLEPQFQDESVFDTPLPEQAYTGKSKSHQVDLFTRG